MAFEMASVPGGEEGQAMETAPLVPAVNEKCSSSSQSKNSEI